MEGDKYRFIVSDWVISSHDDNEYFEEVTTGINESFELCVRLEASLYGFWGEGLDDRKCFVEAYASRNDAYELARRMNVPMTELPSRLARKCTVARDVDEYFPSSADIHDCFFEIVAMLDAHHIPYKYRHKDASGPGIRKNPYRSIR